MPSCSRCLQFTIWAVGWGLVANHGVSAADPASPAKTTIVSWNVEAGGSDPKTVRQQLDGLKPFDIVALSEVPFDATEEFKNYWRQSQSIVGQSGGPSRMLIAWDDAQYEASSTAELKQIGGREFAPGIQAAPLVVHLKRRSDGREFSLAMNHFARGSEQLRMEQALLFAQWGRDLTKPCVAVGGYNFDYDFRTRQGNASFQAFQKQGVWRWIEPREWIDNNWADRNRDGVDDYPESMLDFTFVTGKNEGWTITTEIIVRPGDFPDSDTTPDHRPSRTVIQ